MLGVRWLALRRWLRCLREARMRSWLFDELTMVMWWMAGVTNDVWPEESGLFRSFVRKNNNDH